MILRILAVLVIDAFAAVNNLQQAHADDDNGNDKKKTCNDQHSDYYKMLTKRIHLIIEVNSLHKLTHLRINEHSYRFWDLIHKLMPNYEEN